MPPSEPPKGTRSRRHKPKPPSARSVQKAAESALPLSSKPVRPKNVNRARDAQRATQHAQPLDTGRKPPTVTNVQAPRPRVQAKPLQAAPPRNIRAGKPVVTKRQERSLAVAAYDQLPSGAAKRAHVRAAQKRIGQGQGTTGDKAIVHAHQTRVQGQQRVAAAGRAFNALAGEQVGSTGKGLHLALGSTRRDGRLYDPQGRDIGKAGPTAADVRKQGSVANLPSVGKVAATLAPFATKGLDKTPLPKVIKNIPKDIGELAVTSPTAVVKSLSTAVSHPKQEAKAIVGEYSKLAKDPKKFVTDKPVTAALMLNPLARAPGLAAGKALRVAGKQSLRREAATLPATALREERTGSRAAGRRAVQAVKDKRAAAQGARPRVTARQLDQRVDEAFAAAQHHAARVRSSIGKTTKDLAKEHPKGSPERADVLESGRLAAKGAVKHQTQRSFAREFGATAWVEHGTTPHERLIHPDDVEAFTKNAAVGRVLHHGTATGDGLTREGFDFSKARRHTFGHGVYASSERAIAERYGKVVPVAVHFKKALHLDKPDDMTTFTRTRSQAFRELDAESKTPLRDPGLDKDVAKAVQRRHAEILRKHGYDGIVAGDEHVALVPTAVRVVSKNAPRGISGPRIVEHPDATEGHLHSSVEDARAVADHLNAQNLTIKRGHGNLLSGDPVGRLYSRENVPVKFVVRKVGEAKHAVVPEQAAQRLSHHQSVGSTQARGAKILRTSRTMFTRAVLPYRPSWLSGQAIEGTVRAAIKQAGPTSYLRNKRFAAALERREPGSSKAFLERTAPSGLVGSHQLETPQRTLHGEFPESNVARALTDLGRQPGIKQVRDLNRHVTDFVFNKVNAKGLEGVPQAAMLGKVLKDSPLMERKLIGLSNKAMDEAAAGGVRPETAASLKRELQKSYGKYEGYSPHIRELISHWTPFLPWYLNTAKFLFSTLPKDHPIATALIADMDSATEEWRKQQGLSYRNKENRVPGFMLGGYPVKGNSIVGKALGLKKNETHMLRIGHYTPAGIGSDVLGATLGLPLPQFSGFYNATLGLDWKNQPLKHEDGRPFTDSEKFVYGLTQLAEAMIPLSGQVAGVTGVPGLEPPPPDKGEALKKLARPISAVTRKKDKKRVHPRKKKAGGSLFDEAPARGSGSLFDAGGG